MLPIDSRRSSIHLMGEILRLLRLGDVGKTEVMYAVRLSYYQTQSYLRRLIELGLIHQAAPDDHISSYGITQKGLGLLGKLEQLQEQLQEQEIPQIFDSPELKLDERPYGGTFKRLLASKNLTQIIHVLPPSRNPAGGLPAVLLQPRLRIKPKLLQANHSDCLRYYLYDRRVKLSP
jgi:predicted transcriptional regulator